MNRGMWTALAAIGLAQLMKVPLQAKEKGQWDWSALWSTGGMPSSHSASVSALASYVALKRGLCSVDFALSALFGMIVMYDAMGIRRHAGEMAVEVNRLRQDVEKLVRHHPEISTERRERELKEMLGHIPQEVAAGAVLGTAVGTLSYLTGRPGR